MKNYIPFILLLFISFYAIGQQPRDFTKYEVTGTILEKSNKQALEFATIIFRPEKGKQVFGGLSDEKGNFRFEVPQGFYTVSIEFLSFKTITMEHINIDQDKNLGVIYIEEDAQKLDEVELIAEKSTVEIHLDKKIYNVGKDMTIKGGTASDVLDNVPSVTVDADGVVSLRGNANVRILINGKPSAIVGLNDTEALRQFPADAIKSVEVITSPSARYDAEGTAGILNIILRQDKTLGFNGLATLSTGIPANYGISTNLNYRLSKVNFFTNIGYNDRDSPGNANTQTENFPENGENSFVDEDISIERNRKSWNSNIGAEYFFNEKTSLTGSFLYRKSNSDDISENNSNILFFNPDSEIKNFRREYEIDIDEVFQYSLNFTKNFKKSGHKFNFDFQLEDSSEEENSDISNEQLFPIEVQDPSEKVNSNQEEKNILLQGDYTLPIGENQQFEAGFRSTLLDQTTDYRYFNEVDGEFIINNNLSNIFEYDENIHALYGQYGNKFGKISGLFGLRMEITDIDINVKALDEYGDIINLNSKKDYTNFFPTVNLAYEINENENFTLGYNQRISRPRSRFINPFRSLASETSYFEGNPDLDPSISNSVDLGFFKRWEKITLNSSIYYSHATDVFQFITQETGETTPDGVPIIKRTPINLATDDRYGFELSANYTPIKQWRFNASFNFFNSTLKGEYDGVDYGSQNASWFARFSSKIVIFKDIDWQTTMMYRGPSQNSQNTYKGMFMANMAFSKDILKGDGTISFNVDDIFNSRKRASETTTDSFYSTSEFQWRERSFRLSFAYRFNQKKKRERSGGMENGGGDEGEF